MNPGKTRKSETQPTKHFTNEEPNGSIGKLHSSLLLKLSLFLGLVSFLLYANTLTNGFVLDDHTVIKDNLMVTKGISAIPDLLVTPYLHGWNESLPFDIYKPLSLVLFSVVYQFAGLQPMPFHIISVLLFCGCVILLFRFLDRLFLGEKTYTVFVAALLFAFHPIHTEVVANIKSCDELLCFFFAFLALNLFTGYMETGRRLPLFMGCLSFLLSLLSKETSITFLAIIPFIFFFYRNENRKRAIFIMSASFLIAGIFLTAHFSVLAYFHANHPAHIELIENALAKPSLPFESRLATVMLILGKYLQLLFYPWPLICDYSFNSIPYVHFTNAWVLFSLLLYVMIKLLMIYRFRKNHKDPMVIGILFYLVPLILFSNIFFLIGATMAERFMFFGSAGFCLCLAIAAEQLAAKRALKGIQMFKSPLVAVPLLVICSLFGVIVLHRNQDWSDNLKLYKADLAKAPEDIRLNYYVADELLLASENEETTVAQIYLAEAKSELRKATDAYPGYILAHFDLGLIMEKNGETDSAIVHFKRSLELYPNQLNLLYRLSRIYFGRKQFDLSIEYNKRALELNPANFNTYANIGMTYIQFGKPDSAIYYAHRSMALNPDFPGSYEVISKAWSASGNMDSAQKYSELARIKKAEFKQ